MSIFIKSGFASILAMGGLLLARWIFKTIPPETERTILVAIQVMTLTVGLTIEAIIVIIHARSVRNRSSLSSIPIND